MSYNKLSAKGAAFTRAHEGFVGEWYLDPVGVPTIGIGFTWRSASFRVWWSKNKPGVKFARGATITRAEAEDALRYLVDDEYGKAVNNFLGRKVDQHVYDAMTSAVFNLGPGALKWKWAAAIKRGDIAEAARRLEKTGTTARGVTLAGLVRRRKEEAELLRTGRYTGVSIAGMVPGVGDVVTAQTGALSDGVLKRGERGPDVAKLLRDLSSLGFYEGVMDDVYGSGAESAVLAYQREKSLVSDGEAGPVTLTSIARDVATTGANGGPWWLALLKSLMKDLLK